MQLSMDNVVLRLCKFFDLSEGYFLRLQNDYETIEATRIRAW